MRKIDQSAHTGRERHPAPENPCAERGFARNTADTPGTIPNAQSACRAESPPARPGVFAPDGEPEGRSHPQAAPPLLRLALGCREAAAAIGLSERSFRRGVSAGRVPQGLKIGGRRVWPLDGPNGLKAWLAAGCPPAGDWWKQARA